MTEDVYFAVQHLYPFIGVSVLFCSAFRRQADDISLTNCIMLFVASIFKYMYACTGPHAWYTFIPSLISVYMTVIVVVEVKRKRDRNQRHEDDICKEFILFAVEISIVAVIVGDEKDSYRSLSAVFEALAAFSQWKLSRSRAEPPHVIVLFVLAISSAYSLLNARFTYDMVFKKKCFFTCDENFRFISESSGFITFTAHLMGCLPFFYHSFCHFFIIMFHNVTYSDFKHLLLTLSLEILIMYLLTDMPLLNPEKKQFLNPVRI